jgi:AcrR family transcriptional regulator
MEPNNRIIAFAHSLFMQRGIRAVSMDEIAIGLGMSKKTLYQHFADKDQLVDAVVADHLGRMQAEARQWREQAQDAVHEMFITMEQIQLQLSNMNPILLHDMQKFHPRAYEQFRTHRDVFLFALVRANMQWGIEEGYYRNELDIDVLCRYRLSSMMLPFNTELFPPQQFNLGKLSQHLLQHFVFGLVTEKGYKRMMNYYETKTI